MLQSDECNLRCSASPIRYMFPHAMSKSSQPASNSTGFRLVGFLVWIIWNFGVIPWTLTPCSCLWRPRCCHGLALAWGPSNVRRPHCILALALCTRDVSIFDLISTCSRHYCLCVVMWECSICSVANELFIGPCCSAQPPLSKPHETPSSKTWKLTLPPNSNPKPWSPWIPSSCKAPWQDFTRFSWILALMQATIIDSC